MTHRLTTNCAKNYCNRTLIVKVIIENVVTCFLGTRCSASKCMICYRAMLCTARMLSQNVNLSVRPSVTIRHCVKTAKHVEILSKSDNPITLRTKIGLRRGHPQQGWRIQHSAARTMFRTSLQYVCGSRGIAPAGCDTYR